MFTTLTRLQERDAAQWQIDQRFDHYQKALTDVIEKASREALEYAQQFEQPVVVLEDLSDIGEGLDYSEWTNRRLRAWAFARLQDRIEDSAREAGLPVRYVRPEYTSHSDCCTCVPVRPLLLYRHKRDISGDCCTCVPVRPYAVVRRIRQ